MNKNAFIVWSLALLCVLMVSKAGASENRLVRGHVPKAVAQLVSEGRLPSSNSLALAIGLPLRNQKELDRLLEDLYDPASPHFHQYLNPDQFAERFGPTEKDYAAVQAFAAANGLRVTATHPNRMVVDVSGKVEDIEKAFQVNLRTYRHPKESRDFYAPDTEPSVDSSLPVLHISGLDNFVVPRPLSLKRALLSPSAQVVGSGGSSLSAGTLNGGGAPSALHNGFPQKPGGVGPGPVALDTHKMTGVTPATGSGQGGTYMGNDFRAAYVPGVQLSGAGQSVGLLEFDGFYTNDIISYESQAGLTNVPLITVLLDGFDGFAGSANVEVALDIDMAVSMAPGLSSVIIYEGLLTDSILNRMATDNQARQLSASWLYPIDATSEQIFQQFAAQGQSFFNASGDGDAWVGPIFPPADDPFITVVGGTTLTTTGPRGAWASETAWNWGGGTGTGGGISTAYSIPSWQQGISMVANKGSTTMRNIPDVALTADNVFVIADNGYQYNVGGTSAATPLWAGFMALVNQQASANGKPAAGFINPTIYALGQQAAYTLGLHDITTGDNTWFGSPNLFYAVPGYDLCTGWGTPNGSNLIAAMVARADSLQISPGIGFAASGPPGGPFSPSAQVYSLKSSAATPLNWSLVNTSAWLSVSATSGQIQPGGQPASVNVSLNAAASNLVVGSYTASIRFTNLNTGFVQSRQILLQVAAAPAVITSQPANQAVLPGGTATFSVTATGQGLHYYWKKSGTTLTDGGHISGSATSSLTINNASVADVAVYSVIVSNTSGPVTSSGASLIVYSSGGAELVQNGGFETGTFAGWSVSGNTNLVAVTTNTFATHSGAYGAEFGAAVTMAYLSQTVTTTPGAVYLLSAWLNSPDGRSPNEFLVQWGGSTLFDVANLGATGWTNLQFIVTATNTSSVLQFGFRDDPTYLALDDVSVTLVTYTASPPVFNSQPAGQLVAAGTPLTLSATVSGTTPITYQWMRNGANLANSPNLSGVATPQLSISSTAVSNAGTYVLVASNVYGVSLSAAANLIVLPSGASVLTFDDLQDTSDGLQVPGGYGGLSWNNFYEVNAFEVENILGASGYNAGVVSSNNVVFNAGGFPASITSAAGPFNLYAAYLTAAWNDNLQVQVLGYTGGGAPTYVNTYTLSATAPTLILFNYTNVTEVDFSSSGGTPHPGYGGSGEHFVMDNMAVSFSGPVAILQQPTNQPAAPGQNVVFSVGAVGSLPLSYQWLKNGVSLANGGRIYGANGSSLTISNVALSDASVYSVIVSNSYGPVASAGAALSVYSFGSVNLVQNGGFEAGDFTGWSQYGYTSYNFVTGTNPAAIHSGSFGAELGPPSSSYLDQVLTTIPGSTYWLSFWLKSLPNSGFNYFDIYWNGTFVSELSDLPVGDWHHIQMPVTATYSSTDLEFGFEDDYGYFALDDVSVSIVTNIASPPVITNQPVAQEVVPGGTASFSVAASGGLPFSYQWRQNGTNLADGAGVSGSATANLTIVNVSSANVGTYSVVVSNAYGSVVSASAALVIPPAGSILITFDDLPVTTAGYALSNSYGGLNWSNFFVLNGPDYEYSEGPNGYSAGVVSSPNVAYDGYGATARILSSSGSFNLYSAFLTAAWYDNLQVKVLGFVGSNSLAFSNVYVLSATTPTLATFNFTNVTRVDFTPSGGSQHQGYYGAGEHFAMDNLAVSFDGPVAIVYQPTNLTVFSGQTAIFRVSATGTMPLSYQWQENGVNLTDGGNISGSGSSTLIISNVSVGNAGVYSVSVSNVYGAVPSAGAALAVYTVGGGNLVANGGFETGDFTGWTQTGNSKSSYVTSNAPYVHSGSYGAQMGPYGSSGGIYQTVATAPGSTYLLSLWLDSQPPSGNTYCYVYWNGSVLFSRYNPGLFGWTNVQFLVSASSSSTSLELDFENDLAYFGLDDVSLTPISGFSSPPAITLQPVSQLAPSGGSASFSVGVNGTSPLSFRWRMNGTNLSDGAGIFGSATSSLTVSGVSPANAGTYSVVISNAYGVANSLGASLSILPPGQELITFDDLPETLYGLVVTNGYAGLNWYNIDELDGINSTYYLPGSRAGVVSPNNVGIDESGGPAYITSSGGSFNFIAGAFTATYYSGYPIQVLGYSGSTLRYNNSYYLRTTAPTQISFNYSNVTEVYLYMNYYPFVMDNLVVSTNGGGGGGSAPTITYQPYGESVPVGSSASFYVTAAGTPTLGYQWRLNGVNLNNSANISGANTATLTINSAGVTNVGGYTVVVTNNYGSVTSLVATLTVSTLGTNNLIQNGGFETGDFTGWAISGDPKNLYVSSNAFYVHSGQFGAQLGPYNWSYLSQTIQTTPGQSYLISFSINPDGQGYSYTYFGGYQLYYPYSIPANGWTNMQFTATAYGTTSTLEFEFEDSPGYMGLDDVTVTNYVFLTPPPIPAQLNSAHAGNGAIGFSFQTVPGQSYTIQQCTNLAGGSWSTYYTFIGDGTAYHFAAPMDSNQRNVFYRVREP